MLCRFAVFNRATCGGIGFAVAVCGCIGFDAAVRDISDGFSVVVFFGRRAAGSFFVRRHLSLGFSVPCRRAVVVCVAV